MEHMKKTKALTESALLVALATVLSVLAIAHLPYGGSITLASMLPLLIIAYRHGMAWGLSAGAAFALIQQLLGLSNLSYFTTWQSIVAVVVLDYLLAFTLTGLGGVFRRVIARQSRALVCGALLVCVLRYACHVVAGATVWAGLSIPTEAALLYSLGYNATYMIPETLVLLLAAHYLGSLIDFRRATPVRMAKDENTPATGRNFSLSLPILTAVLIADVVLLFPHAQNPESGAFDLSALFAQGFVDSPWLPVCIVTALGAVLALALRKRHN